MFVMSFWLVKNYRMEPAFAFDNWCEDALLEHFLEGLWLTFGLAAIATVLATASRFRPP